MFLNRTFSNLLSNCDISGNSDKRKKTRAVAIRHSLFLRSWRSITLWENSDWHEVELQFLHLKKIAIYSAQKIAVVLDWLTLSQTNMGVSEKVQNHYRNIWEKSLKNIFFQELQYMYYSLYCNKDCYITIKRPRTAVTGIIYAYSAFFYVTSLYWYKYI